VRSCGAGRDRTDEWAPRFHWATPDATRSDVSSASGNANEPRRNAKAQNKTANGRHFNARFNRTPGNAPRVNVNFAGADGDAAHVDIKHHVRSAPF